jgi:Na+-translocating ferredoxin:NAD+ oxidoreductase RNF subunit RnfB
MNEHLDPEKYFHSVRLIEDKCKGCVTCIKHCPTEAIRVRDGKATILEVRCVDCGECIRICPNQAKTAFADTLEQISKFKYKVALPAPALYGQFRGGIKPERILAGLIHLGFDDVYEVAYAAEMVAGRVRQILQDPDRPKPLLSSSCPAIVRLIQVRFPEYIGNIVPAVSPMRLAARLARKEITEKLGIPNEDIGVFFITPCPGKVSAIADPVGYGDHCINGAIPVSEIYTKLHSFIYNASDDEVGKQLRKASGIGIGWGRCGGEVIAIGAKKHISVDGIHHVIQIMEEMGRGKLLDMDYIEMLACVGGCVGGVLTVDNPFISRRRLRELATQDGPSETDEQVAARQAELLVGVDPEMLEFDEPIEPRPTLRLDDDMAAAIRKMERLEEIVDSLPGIDCGSCGSPHCRALAEDIVRGLAVETDCIFKLRERVNELAGEMAELAAKLPPSMGALRKEPAKHDADGDSPEAGIDLEG